MIQKQILGSIIIKLNKIDSTNNYAMKLTNEGMAVNGTVVTAAYQSVGKGQYGNSWESEIGKNLLCSVILDASEFDKNQMFLLHCMVCNAIAAVLHLQYGIPDVTIKWPNDIYAGKQKISGVLIENKLRGSSWKNAIVGIGLNINQTFFPDATNATSMKNELNKNYSIKMVLNRILKAIALQLNIMNNNPQELLKIYNENLFSFQKKILFKTKSVIKQGILKGVTDKGLIAIESSGKIKYYKHKEVLLVM